MSKKTKIIIIACASIVALIIAGIFVKQAVSEAQDKSAAERVSKLIEQMAADELTAESENMLISINAEYNLLTDKQKALVANYAVLEKLINDVQTLKDKTAAEKVMNLIKELEGTTISIESESMILSAKAEYNVLTDKQKELVTNYAVLEELLDKVQELKDKEVAEDFDDEVGDIDPWDLAASKGTIKSLLSQYDNMTERQKSFVKKYKVLLEYNERYKAIDMASNFKAYSGKWGDFGSHKNAYQGMIEKKIQQNVTYKNIFTEPVNSLYFYISEFDMGQYSGDYVAYFRFEGTDAETGFERAVEGQVVVTADGIFFCEEY